MKGIELQFVNWLHNELDAYDEWATLLWKEQKIKVSVFLRGEEPRFWVDNAFVYPKGQKKYWEDIEKKWAEELEDIINTKYYKR